MKYTALALALASTIAINAQDKPTDKRVETQTRIINVMDDGEMIEKKIMVKTTMEQKVKTDPAYEGTIDAPRVFPPKEMTKVIYIDNDSDPFYDELSRMIYYKKNDEMYNFVLKDYGFDVMNPNDKMSLTKVKFSNNPDVYLVNDEDYSGIGYFNDGEFIVEYYNDDNILIVDRYERTNK